MIEFFPNQRVFFFPSPFFIRIYSVFFKKWYFQSINKIKTKLAKVNKLYKIYIKKWTIVANTRLNKGKYSGLKYYKIIGQKFLAILGKIIKQKADINVANMRPYPFLIFITLS